MEHYVALHIQDNQRGVNVFAVFLKKSGSAFLLSELKEHIQQYLLTEEGKEFIEEMNEQVKWGNVIDALPKRFWEEQRITFIEHEEMHPYFPFEVTVDFHENLIPERYYKDKEYYFIEETRDDTYELFEKDGDFYDHGMQDLKVATLYEKEKAEEICELLNERKRQKKMSK